MLRSIQAENIYKTENIHIHENLSISSNSQHFLSTEYINRGIEVAGILGGKGLCKNGEERNERDKFLKQVRTLSVL